MNLAAWLCGRHRIEALGEQWGVAYTFGALLRIEQTIGINVLRDGIRFDRLGGADLRTVLHVLLTESGCKLSIEACGALLSIDRIGPLRRELQSAWRDSMPLPSRDREKPGKPRRIEWLSAWAIARQELRLQLQEWLSLTPRMLHALQEHALEERRQGEHMLATLTASAINFSASPPKKQVYARQFMLHPWPERDEPIWAEDFAKGCAPFIKKKGSK